MKAITFLDAEAHNFIPRVLLSNRKRIFVDRAGNFSVRQRRLSMRKGGRLNRRETAAMSQPINFAGENFSGCTFKVNVYIHK